MASLTLAAEAFGDEAFAKAEQLLGQGVVLDQRTVTAVPFGYAVYRL